MATKTIAAQITIGGAITSAFRSALTTTSDKIKDIGRAIGDLKAKQKELNTEIKAQDALGAQGNALRVGNARKELADTERQISALRQKQTVLKQELELQAALKKGRGELGAVGASLGAAGVGVGLLLRNPLKAFEELDAAINNMEVAMLDKDGGLPKAFDSIKKQTVELGNLLPGTTADFVNLATVLKEKGTPIQTIANGALKAAAHLAVILKLPTEQAGELVAKLREAFGVQEEEFARVADLTQRAKFGFGLGSDDLLLGAKYFGGKLNALGLTGVDNVKQVLALQGQAAQAGVDGSTFGTNFSEALTKIGLMNEKLHKNSKEIRAVNAVLDTYKIKLEFFDKAGNFLGLENAVEQISKLNTLSPQQRIQVNERLFGERGGRFAETVEKNGTPGFKKSLGVLDNEASLDQRLDKAVSSFKNRLEALSGTFTNFLAEIGRPIAKIFTPVIEQLNIIIGGPMQKWVEQNQKIVGIVGAILAGAAGLLVIGGAIAAFGFAISFLIEGFTLIGPAFATIGPALATVGAIFSGPVLLGIGAVIAASWILYKNWDVISSFLDGVWTGFTDGMNTSFPILEKIGNLFSWLADQVGLFDGKINHSAETLDKANNAGRSFGDVLAKAFNAIGFAIDVVMIPITTLGTAIGLLAADAAIMFDSLGKLKNGDFAGAFQGLKSIWQNSVDAATNKASFGLDAFDKKDAGQPTGLPTPAVATRAPVNNVLNDSSKIDINILQAPGQNPQDVAKQVQDSLARIKSARAKSVMFDPLSP